MIESREGAQPRSVIRREIPFRIVVAVEKLPIGGVEKGGLGALSLCKESRAALEQSLKLDPVALQGSAHTSLGSLFYQVPGWPIGFGDKDAAREHLTQALALNPDGIDPNYFMADFLHDSGKDKDALSYLDKAAQAPARPGRELADQGRRKEIEALRKAILED